jgi:acyl phosphate:glycerol-3-phosphate acyltransferase
MHPALGLVLSYVLGSIPAAYIAGKATRGIDLRQHGSGNLGATNVYRTLGAKVAIVVLLVDALKGALPVLFFPRWTTSTIDPVKLGIAYGIAAIIGHVRPVFLLWKGGGKGVATAAGVFFALVPVAMAVALGVWLVVVFVSGYVSLASLAASVALPLTLALTTGVQSPLFVVSVLIAAFVFWSHRANIGRLRRGEEYRFGKKKGDDAASSSGGAL